MIEEIQIKKNPKNIFKSYLSEIEFFKTDQVIKFKEGINIIVGKNGSGKSTLLEILSTFGLCLDGESKYPDPKHNRRLFRNNELVDGIIIKSDYKYKIFRFQLLRDLESDNIKDFKTFGSYYNSINSSYGESVRESLFYLFDLAFSSDDLRFPLEEIKNSTPSNMQLLAKYYEENRIDGNEITFLMDEPDRNLDIFGIESLYKILSFHKPRTQIIAVIHNPILIYKLYKNSSDINWIEMSEDYIKNTLEFISNP